VSEMTDEALASLLTGVCMELLTPVTT